MTKTLLVSWSILVSLSQIGFAGQNPSSKQVVISDPTAMPSQEGYTSGEYLRGKGEDESHKAYLDKLKLKQNPMLAYNAKAEQTLTHAEAALYKALEEEETSEKAIKTNVEKIAATMDSTYTSVLKVLTLGYVKNNHPDAGKYSQEDLDAVRHQLESLQKTIKEQEKDLEEVSQSLNEMMAEKAKLETTTPGFFNKANKASEPKALKTKRGEINIQDTQNERLKNVKLGIAQDSSGVAILAERFILKLAALDETFDILISKIQDFRARVTQDKAIIKLMNDDPEFKQGGVALWEKLYARIFVVGNTPAGLTPDENARLRTGLAKIKKVLSDEVAQYEKVIGIFENYTHTLPDKINGFKKTKVDFFKRQHKETKKDLDALHKKAIADLIVAEKEKNKTLIVDLRHRTGSLQRQLFFLDRSMEIQPLTEKELMELKDKLKKATAGETEESTKEKSGGSIDEMLETLVTLTQITQESGSDMLNPVLKDKLKGFFGATLVREVAIKAAPTAIATLTGIAQSKLAEYAAAGGVVKNSSQLQLLKIISQINGIDSKLAIEGHGAPQNKSDLTKQRDILKEELAAFMSLVNCKNDVIDTGKRHKSCKKALAVIDQKSKEAKIKKANLSPEDTLLVNERESLSVKLKELDAAMKKDGKLKSSAKNEIQRQQESLGMVFDALVDVVDGSKNVRDESVVSVITNALPEFRNKTLEGSKKKLVAWVVPLLSGIVDARIEEKIDAANPDPTKRKYYDAGIPALLIARITAEPGSPEYNKIEAQINKAYADVMAVRQAYKQSVINLGSHEKKGKFALGYGPETGTSKRQEQLLIQNAKKGAIELTQKSETASAAIKKQAGK